MTDKKSKLDSYQIDEKLKPILRKMEEIGVKLDVKLLERLSKEASLGLEKLTKKAHDLVGYEFNLDSPSQLSRILYKELKIDPGKAGIRKGKAHFSTGASALEKIIDRHELVDLILKYRELAKLKNTYLDPLAKLVDENDRVHTHYAVDTATGRFSSKNPNLQNIPTRTDQGKEVKKAFVCEKGYRLLKFDYSQIELRIVAHLSGDSDMVNVFKSGKDIHAETGKKMGVDRRMAKVINFGVLYGMGSYGLSQRLGITLEKAQEFINTYFSTYPGLKKYFDETIKQAKKNGFVETLYARRRDVSQLDSKIYSVRKNGERIAVNTPAQGTAAEIIKLAMIDLDQKDLTNKEDIKMILQVHDELVFEIKENKVKDYAKKIKNVMENVVKLDVPLEVTGEVGDNWGEMEELNI